MTPTNSITPKATLSILTVRYSPTDSSKLIYGYRGVVECHFKRLMTLTGKKRSEPRNEKLDLIRKSQVALNDPGRHEAMKVLFSPQTLDVYVRGKDGFPVHAQISPLDYRHLVNRLVATARKQEVK